MQKKKFALTAITVWALCNTTLIHAQSPAAAIPQPDWGEIIVQTNGTGEVLLKVKDWPKDGKLKLPELFPEITAVRLAGESLSWLVDSENRKSIELPNNAGNSQKTILVETVGNKRELVGGRIVFAGSSGQISGSTQSLPPTFEPGSGRNQPFAESRGKKWNFRPTRWGMYDVELVYSTQSNLTAQIEVEIIDKKFTTNLPPTGSNERLRSAKAGRYYIQDVEKLSVPKSAQFPIGVMCHWQTKPLGDQGPAEIKAIVLRPAPEGGPIVQAENGAFSLPASNAITHSVLMRYEPAAIKNCMGYWMNPADWAEWIFDVKKPGTFEIEVWQGCGKGSGGSDVYVEAGGKQYPFVVEDTGHFQNFVPRRVGQVTFDKPGEQSLQIHVKRQQKSAIMDIREVKLLPVEK